MGLRLTTVVLLLALPCAWLHAEVRTAGQADYWQVRSHGSGLSRAVESTSVINGGRPRGEVPATAVLVHRQAGSVALRLHADESSMELLQAPGVDFGPELDKALAWLGRLTTGTRAAARIELHLVTPDTRARLQRRHPAAETTVVELMVPLQATQDVAATSAGVGQALATALHEMTHALDAGSGRPRAEDEYRASLVGACYLADTLQPGHTMQLRDAPAAPANESFVSTHSREASARAMDDMAKAAGGRRIAWYDRTAMMGLQLFCATRLAGLQTPSAG